MYGTFTSTWPSIYRLRLDPVSDLSVFLNSLFTNSSHSWKRRNAHHGSDAQNDKLSDIRVQYMKRRFPTHRGSYRTESSLIGEDDRVSQI